MTRASEVIGHLLPRRAAPLLERVTGLPHGWGLWLRGQATRRGAITHARPMAVTAWALSRPFVASTAERTRLTRWQALRSLFHQHWDPPPREERWIRWCAGAFSLLLHVGFALLLIVLALVSYLPPISKTELSRTQVSFIGDGTPRDEQGGAPAPDGAPSTDSTDGAAEAAPSAPRPQPEPGTVATEPAEVASDAQAPVEASVPELPPAPVEPAPPAPQPPVESQQNVQVSEADQQPQQAFVLPPMTAPQLPQIQTRAPEITVPQREVTVVERPAITAPAMPQKTLEAPSLRPRELNVREREIPSPSEPLPEERSTRAVVQREVQIRQQQVPTPSVAQREVRMPEIAPPPLPTPEPPAPAPATSPAQPLARAAPTPQTTDTARPNAQQAASAAPASTVPAAGTSAPAPDHANPAPPGATPAPTPGGWASTQKADDWGVADRPTSGARGSDALFNADGSAKLAGEGDGKAQDKGPPGSRQAQAIDANKAGEWLDRPPAITYEQSKFERYWVPNESLLEEWVRRNIREMEIPIPGTSKRIKCVVSVLQLGGGCGVYDPNLNEQPPQARPPPQIPVKRTPIPEGS
ncbi:MAG: hypothetical protein ABW178_10035 [Pseudoxanthomonas sp.]